MPVWYCKHPLSGLKYICDDSEIKSIFDRSFKYLHRDMTNHATYSLVDPHGIWVTLISHVLVAVVDAVLNEKARLTVSDDEAPMST